MVPGPVHAAASGRRMKVLQRKNRPDSEESGGSPYASSCLCADPAGRTLDVRLASSGICLSLYAGEKGKVKPFVTIQSREGGYYRDKAEECREQRLIFVFSIRGCFWG